MHKKLRMALVAALVMAGGWGATASATSDGGNCDRNGQNASGCDFDDDGVNNQDDTDDDNDGTPDDEELDGCGRNAEDACGEGDGGGGENPELPVNPDDLLALVQAAVEDALAQLPAGPGGEEPPGEEPPSEDPDPAAEVQAVVEGIVSQVPAPPSDPGAVEALVQEIVGQVPAPPAPPAGPSDLEAVVNDVVAQLPAPPAP